MWEIFTYDFVVRALIIGTLVAIVASLVGNFVVAAKQSIISDMLAHAALAGVGIGILFHISPVGTAFVVTLLFSLLLWFFALRTGRAPDAFSMLLLTGGLAIAILCAHIAKDNPISFDTYLFGSILTVSSVEMMYYIFAMVVICVVMSVVWSRLLLIVFDPQFARTQISSARTIEIIFMLIIAAVVALSLKVIGGLLIGALFVIPVLCAQNSAQSFRANVFYSAIYGVVGVWGGIITSFYYDIPTSSGIVLLLIALFLITSLVRMVRKR
jgi:zinc transport system permease protein